MEKMFLGNFVRTCIKMYGVLWWTFVHTAILKIAPSVSIKKGLCVESGNMRGKNVFGVISFLIMIMCQTRRSIHASCMILYHYRTTPRHSCLRRHKSFPCCLQDR